MHITEIKAGRNIPSLESSRHTEPVAIEKSMASWVCKVMFWYAAQAESIDEQFSNTQDTGEKFRMRCKCTEDAALWVSFAKDEGSLYGLLRR